MSELVVIVSMMAAVLALLACGLPIAFVLGGVSIVFGYIFWDPVIIDMVMLKANDMMRPTTLLAVPLFVFMAAVLQGSGVAEALYNSIDKWLGGVPGGLAIGTVIACTFVAAMSGLSSTGVVMMGILGFPAMMALGYDKNLVMGSIMGSSALGMLIPPSVVMIIYGLVAEVSIGRLFLAGVVPGLLLSGIYVLYIFIRCQINPALGPRRPKEERASLGEKIASVKAILLPIAVIAVVLGSIFAGVATPTEAAGLGALGALLAALTNRRLNWNLIRDSSDQTYRVVIMALWIILGATVFAAIYQGLGATGVVRDVLGNAGMSKWAVLITMQIVWIILGCFLDSISILLITGPIFIPLANAFGFDMVWFGILYTINVEMAALTPPFGFNLFVMRSIVSEREASMAQIYRSAVPFIIIHAFVLILVMLVPGLALWLPAKVF